MVVIIPAYEPDGKLLGLIEELNKKCNCKILIVDDGSGEKYDWIFEKAENFGAVVVRYSRNKGKGGAMKTAFNIVKDWNEAEEIVTVDCDGQHLPGDIIKIMKEVKVTKSKVILGSRQFTGKVPLRSIFGNKLTSMVFQLAKGKKITDTQTGLRGFSRDMIPWLCEIKGDRFEYEMNMLLEADENNYEIKEVTIDTVYLEDNKSSHFNPLRDSIKIYLPFLKFGISSVFSALLDFILLIFLKLITSNLFLAVVVARLCSGTFNYTMNKKYVFSREDKHIEENNLSQYAILASILMFINYTTLNFLSAIGINLVVGKIITEVLLFMFSFLIQKRYVFEYKHAFK